MWGRKAKRIAELEEQVIDLKADILGWKGLEAEIKAQTLCPDDKSLSQHLQELVDAKTPTVQVVQMKPARKKKKK